ncbi:3952_t:CDS:2 [Funneliformis mosseae]|uniref:3952_t:CDS:1 n=1 Tax=Funneliformis mosseae TaxID=27381 RepID=A0A9N8V047_FUNMO|nr:3952_t:CDS:2 [Funneliformis mosseae]
MSKLCNQLKKVGQDRLILKIEWDGLNEAEDEPVKARIKCFSKAVTVIGPNVQHMVFGNRTTQFELKVHKKNVNVQCRFGVIDIIKFKNFIGFRT